MITVNAGKERSGPCSETSPSERLIVRHCRNAHPHMCAYLIRKHAFSDLCRLPQDSADKSKAAHFRDLMRGLVFVLRNLKQIRRAREIVAIGVMACNIALLLKLGLLPACRRLYWFGLFVHSPRWLRILRPGFRALDSEKVRYVLFSKFERPLYAHSLSLTEHRLLYVPYGDMSELTETKVDKEVPTAEPSEKDFYFSGGVSNRDYLSLIEVFRGLPFKLVIVCSSLNTEVDEAALPSNIRVLRDITSELFDAYAKISKACVITIAHDTGAAGQSCLLRYMQYGKIIIATDTGIIREYIEDGISGILVKNNQEALARAIRDINANVDDYLGLADAAYERFVQEFSGDAIARRLDQLVNQPEGEWIDCHSGAIPLP